MELKEKVKICLTCQHCKRDKRGVVCGLTDEKPTFDFQCPEYVQNDDAVRQYKAQEEAQQQQQLDDEPKLPASHWFRTIGVLSLLNVVLLFTGISFLFGLGSTQIVQILSELGLINKVLGYTIVAVIPLYFLWTWWLTARCAYSYAYIFGLAVYAFDTLLTSILMFEIGANASLIITLLFQLFVIGTLVNSLFKDDSRMNGAKFSWGAHKIVYTVASAVVIITMALSMYHAVNIRNDNENESQTITETSTSSELYVKNMVEQTQMLLPFKAEEGCYMTAVYIDGKDVVMDYELMEGYYDSYVLQNISDDDLKEMMKHMKGSSDYEVAKHGYDIVYNYKTTSGRLIVSWHFASKDILSAN